MIFIRVYYQYLKFKPNNADIPQIIQSIRHKPIEPVDSNTLLFATKIPEPIIVPNI